MQFYNAHANFHTPPNFHDYLEIFLVYQGHGVFRFGDKAYDFARGDVFVIGSNEVHNCVRSDDANTKTIEIYFMPELVYHPGATREDFCHLLPFYNHDDQFNHRVPSGEIDFEGITRQLALIYQELLTRGTFFRLAARNYFKGILLNLARYYDHLNHTVYDRVDIPSKQKRLCAVVDYVRDHYHENLTSGCVAKWACMSPEHFCRFFKKATGSTFTSFLTAFRMARAKALLEQESMSATEIAYEVGFNNYSYFHRVFKNHTEMSPTVYRSTRFRTGMG
jgi:AraC-like DNA-binding protein